MRFYLDRPAKVEKPFFHKLLERAQVGLYAFVDALFIPNGVIKKSQFPVYKKLTPRLPRWVSVGA
jgi:hypothetical protein